jgi:uncharacterized membrane protein
VDQNIDLEKRARKISGKNPHNSKFPLMSILLLFSLAALIMLRQLLTAGYFSCIIEDTHTYTSWAWQFKEALKEGIIYPRWLPLNFWGYGSPTFILYPPLAFYLVAFFNIFTESVITAMNITKFMALFLSGVGMFFLVREFYSKKIALLTSSFYIVFPYNIFQIYFVGTFASTISFLWFAPIILFTYRYMRDRQHRDVLYAGFCYGGLILTHLINAYMFTFVLVAFITCMAIAKRNPGYLMAMPLIIVTGFLISSAYIVPVIFEKQLFSMEHFTGANVGYFTYLKSFILPRSIDVLSSDHLWLVYYKTYFSFVLLFCILILLFLRQLIRLRHANNLGDTKPVNIFFLGVAIGSLFFLFGISRFLWEAIPFFKYIQFSARWLYITVFSLVFMSSVIFWVLETEYKAKRGKTFYIVILFLICIILDVHYIYFAPLFKEQQLIPVRAANFNSEYLPRWVSEEHISGDKLDERVTIHGEGEVNIVAWKSEERIFAVNAKRPLTARIRTFYFPGWKAYVDGVETEIKTEKDVGAMLLDIPEGRHKLVLKFEDTSIRYYAKFLSLVSLVSMVVLVLFSKRKKGNTSSQI